MDGSVPPANMDPTGDNVRTIVRKATLDDAVAIYELLEVMREEGRYPEHNEEKAMRAICGVLQKGIAVVAERDGAIVGSVGLVVASWWFADPQFVRDLWFFVHPEARKGRTALMLLRATQECAKLAGLPLRIDISSLVDTEAKGRFFRRYMTPVGESFMWQPGT